MSSYVYINDSSKYTRKISRKKLI